MKILLLAPHPFYQERGTPIAVDLLIKALSERGDTVHVLTFNEGTDRVYPNVKISRVNPWPRVDGLRPGFSIKKLICDVYMFFLLIREMRREHYDIIHAVEESAFMALVVKRITSTPFVYDMDSSMVTQLIDKFSFLKLLERPLRYLESLPMRYASAVVPVCQALADDVNKYRSDNVVILKDVSLVQDEAAGKENADDLRALCNVKDKMLLYIGNLESYQGIDLLLESFARLMKTDVVADLVIIGGEDADIETYKKLSEQFGINEHVHLIGKRAVGHISQYMKQADVLVSPRIHGVNTPMKVYSYLHSGIAVLATEMPTHTQAMTKDISMLAQPDPESFAEAMLKLLQDDQLRSDLGKKASLFIEKEHSYEAFKSVLYNLYQKLDSLILRP